MDGAGPAGGSATATPAAADAATADQMYLSQSGCGTGGYLRDTVTGRVDPAQLEVLAAIAGGATNRQVAQRLHLSDKTVGRHLANIYAKIGVSSRTAAAAWARTSNAPVTHSECIYF